MDNYPFDRSHGYMIIAVFVNDPYTHMCCPASCYRISEKQTKGTTLQALFPFILMGNAQAQFSVACT